MAKVFAAADIGHKLDHPMFVEFLEKYTKRKVPTRKGLNNRLDSVKEDTKNIIKTELKDEYLWISIDETTDSKQRHLMNLMCGAMRESTKSKGYLIGSRFLNKTKSEDYEEAILSILKEYWNIDDIREKILLIVTDRARTMLKVVRELRSKYFNKAIHKTCFAHAVHNISELIRQKYSKVDKFVSNVKKSFTKCPENIRIFRNVTGNLPLPPKPVLTRWGTWIRAVSYFNINFNDIEKVFEQLDSKYSASVKTVKNILSKHKVKLKKDLIRT